MKKTVISFANNNSTFNTSIARVELVSVCPICHNGISPTIYGSLLSDNRNDITHITLLLYCPSCGNSFIAKYIFAAQGVRLPEPEHDGSFPLVNRKEEFDEAITAISPSFGRIYNQALTSEAYGLNEISGMGYRKALEFLVKDYAIYKNQDSKESIIDAHLSDCIGKYIDDEKIKMLAKKAAWLGNDESHYYQQRDNNVANLKKFIKAILHYIISEATVDEANKVEPTKRQK